MPTMWITELAEETMERLPADGDVKEFLKEMGRILHNRRSKSVGDCRGWKLSAGEHTSLLPSSVQHL